MMLHSSSLRIEGDNGELCIYGQDLGFGRDVLPRERSWKDLGGGGDWIEAWFNPVDIRLSYL